MKLINFTFEKKTQCWLYAYKSSAENMVFFNFHNKEIVYDCAARAKGLIYNEHATANQPLKWTLLIINAKHSFIVVFCTEHIFKGCHIIKSSSSQFATSIVPEHTHTEQPICL